MISGLQRTGDCLMKNIETLTELFKRDTKGKVRTWTMPIWLG